MLYGINADGRDYVSPLSSDKEAVLAEARRRVRQLAEERAESLGWDGTSHVEVLTFYDTETQGKSNNFDNAIGGFTVQGELDLHNWEFHSQVGSAWGDVEDRYVVDPSHSDVNPRVARFNRLYPSLARN